MSCLLSGSLLSAWKCAACGLLSNSGSLLCLHASLGCGGTRAQGRYATAAEIKDIGDKVAAHHIPPSTEADGKKTSGGSVWAVRDQPDAFIFPQGFHRMDGMTIRVPGGAVLWGSVRPQTARGQHPDQREHLRILPTLEADGKRTSGGSVWNSPGQEPDVLVLAQGLHRVDGSTLTIGKGSELVARMVLKHALPPGGDGAGGPSAPAGGAPRPPQGSGQHKGPVSQQDPGAGGNAASGGGAWGESRPLGNAGTPDHPGPQ